MKDRYRVVIVGAGILGLSTAWHLAKRGVTDVLVLDRGYLCGGASGRNGGGVRAQFSSESNIRLMQESIRICRDFAAQMRINVWFRQGGYLFLTRSKERARGLEQSARLQNDCGLRTRLVAPSELRSIVPELDPTGVELASFNPDDGVVFPWPFVWGYAHAAKALGVDLAPWCDVVDLPVVGDRVAAVEVRRTHHGELARWEAQAPTNAAGPAVPSFLASSRGAPGERKRIECDTVLLCTGAWSPELAALVGVELPTHPHRHEICSTEPLKPWLGPLVADLTDGLYFSQSARGEIVGGIGVDPAPKGLNQRSSSAFVGRYARSLVRCVPRMASVRMLRQWAGCYDLSPDGNPIVGRVASPSNVVLASGFMGHGFMMAPVMGRLLAEHVAEGTVSELFERWNLRRFAEGRLLQETMIIG